MSTPDQMPKHIEPLTNRETRRLRDRTRRRIEVLLTKHMPDLSADQMLLLHELLDEFYEERSQDLQAARGQAHTQAAATATTVNSTTNSDTQ